MSILSYFRSKLVVESITIWWDAPEHYSSLSTKTRHIMLRSELTHRQLDSIQSLQRKRQRFLPDFVHGALIQKRLDRDNYLAYVTAFSDIFSDVEDFTDESNFAEDTIKDILAYIHYERDRKRAEDKDASVRRFTDEEIAALVTMRKLVSALPKDQQPAKFPWSNCPKNAWTRTVDRVEGWLTSRTLECINSPEQVLEEYQKRLSRRAKIAGRFTNSNLIHLTADTVPDNMCEYPNELMDTLFRESQDMSKYSLMYNVYHAIKQGANVQEAHDMLSFLPKYTGKISHDTVDVFATLRRYPGLLDEYSDLGNLPSAVQRHCEALLTVAEAMSDYARDDLDHGLIKDPRIIEWLKENPDEAQWFAEIIEERKTADFDLTQTIKSSVLGDGFL